jgi:soluble lytic murein transglycosylase-like protein
MSTAVETASYKYSLHPTLILAIIKNESKFDSKIDNGTGTGLMQVVGSVHGVSKYVLTNPEKNILIGSKILYKCKTKFKSEMKTLQCYNGNFNITYYGNKVLNTKRKYDLLYYSIN